MKAALEKLGLKYEVDDDGDFKVGMRFEDGRTQVAWITSPDAAVRQNGNPIAVIAQQQLSMTQQQLDEERQQRERSAAKLRELSIDPETVLERSNDRLLISVVPDWHSSFRLQTGSV